LDDEERALAIRMVEVDKKARGQVANRFHVDRSMILRMMNEVREKRELRGGVL
jgi:transposase